MARREEYEALLERSKRFYETALMQISKKFYDLAAFSLEQSLQLYLKACLLKLGADYPRTHSVRKLLEHIYKITEHQEINELQSRLSVELGALEDAYIASRYIARSYSLEELKRLKGAVEEVKSIVERAVG
ncbi:MAG: HEPN domain-containing protein [Candidatus Verstraetearchaeota archaeon]|nr:HEPN domain-containing protein [Candidatus Verstraetearchaeota archaeon]